MKRIIATLDGQIEVELTADEIAARQSAEAIEAALSARRNILSQLQALDAQITNRRLTEAFLTDEGKAWLQNIETQKEALRQQLRGL